jgi:YD repeat-containing protein
MRVSELTTAKGNLVTHTDALGNVVRMVCDLLGRTIRVDRPERGSIAVHDAAG